MVDGPDYAAARGEIREDQSVESLASRVISVLAARVNGPRSGVDDRFVDRICGAAQSDDASEHRNAIKEMLAGGVERTTIAEVYIPIAARRLGAAWCEDQVSFTEVTIGTSRLQSMLRSLGDVWSGDVAEPHEVQPTVLMVVPVDEYHTLGAMVATGQLRRAGVSVRLCIGQPMSVLLDLVETFNFDAIMISGASSENLEKLRKLIVDIRYALQKPTPVVIGGAVMELANEIKAITGADHATDDVQEAIRLCRLTEFLHAGPQGRPRA
ncbi:MAG: cobalamin B12-binding domain-containing protein [Rhodobacter sp.]|nr:cobalamin B12-binding domain-containing protein [Rhodobacter sp.]